MANVIAMMMRREITVEIDFALTSLCILVYVRDR